MKTFLRIIWESKHSTANAAQCSHRLGRRKFVQDHLDWHCLRKGVYLSIGRNDGKVVRWYKAWDKKYNKGVKYPQDTYSEKKQRERLKAEWQKQMGQADFRKSINVTDIDWLALNCREKK
jgi:hypothetical protein